MLEWPGALGLGALAAFVYSLKQVNPFSVKDGHAHTHVPVLEKGIGRREIPRLEPAWILSDILGGKGGA